MVSTFFTMLSAFSVSGHLWDDAIDAHVTLQSVKVTFIPSAHLATWASSRHFCNKAVRQRSDLLLIATSFWFEESPCAVRTNIAGLDRLCMLFVLSTLLDFEHMYAVLSSTFVLCCTMVTTRTAAMSNSRYTDTDRVKNVF